MFSKTSKGTSTQSGSQPAVKAAGPSIISADLRIIGDLSSDGEIQIDGTIDGDIRTKSLLVGETANIKGEIVADRIQVHGTINGQIKARSVTLARSARVIGDILHEDLAIENGAFLEGHCKRLVEKKDVDAIKAAIPTGTAAKATPAAAE
ncbi:MAG: cell shape determination protein CcmA [Rhodospirillaceae bacterium]|nr:cell shape determination protein CcmA [Rhodospirillaceae bacterium]